MGYIRKTIETAISWAVPVACAGLLVAWDKVPSDVQHYWPVLILAIPSVASLIMSDHTRKDVQKLHKLHDKDDMMGKAFRAMLDDDMGKIYVACLEKGYSTEDERRRYDRLDAAYTSMGGNGEAARRKPLFHAIKHEEEWKIEHRKG